MIWKCRESVDLKFKILCLQMFVSCHIFTCALLQDDFSITLPVPLSPWLVLYAPLNTAVIIDLFDFLETGKFEHLTNLAGSKVYDVDIRVGICLDVLTVSFFCFLFFCFFSPPLQELLTLRNDVA